MMEPQIDSEPIEIRALENGSTETEENTLNGSQGNSSAESEENTPNDLQPVIKLRAQERQMTPKECGCRICYQRNLSEPNLSLCGCRGTLQLVHKSCLELWLASSRLNKCELCGYRFNLRKKLKYGVFRAIVVWFMLKRTREDRIAMTLDILKLSAALAMLFVINYQTLALLGNIQRLDMSMQDFVNPFFEPELNWNDLADVGNKLFKMFSMAVATPITLDYIATKMQHLDLYISHWYRWYESQVVVELIPPT